MHTCCPLNEIMHWNAQMCAHTLEMNETHIPLVSIKPRIFHFSQRTPFSLIVNAGSQWGSRTASAQENFLLLFGSLRLLVCNNKIEGAFPRFLKKNHFYIKTCAIYVYKHNGWPWMHQHVALSEIFIWFVHNTSRSNPIKESRLVVYSLRKSEKRC